MQPLKKGPHKSSSANRGLIEFIISIFHLFTHIFAHSLVLVYFERKIQEKPPPLKKFKKKVKRFNKLQQNIHHGYCMPKCMKTHKL